MESLSNEILQILFEKMTIQDRVKMRGVSRRMRAFVDQYYGQIQDIVYGDYTLLRNRWFFSHDLIDPQEQLFVDFALTYPSPMLSELRRLKFKGSLRYSDFVRLERFSKLEALEIGCLEFNSLTQTINLPNLRFFCVLSICRPSKLGRYLINSPHVLAVYFGDDSINHIKLASRSTVVYLEFHLDSARRRDSLRYKNARILICNRILQLDMGIVADLITDLPKCDAFHLNVQELTSLGNAVYWGPEMCLQQASRRLGAIHEELLLQKTARELGSCKRIELYLNGIKMENHYNYPGDLLLGKSIHLHYVHFERLLPQVYSVRAIDYDEVMSVVQRFPPMNFVLRYPNISSISLVPHESRLNVGAVLSFLTHYNPMAIQTLIVEYCSLPQFFFDRLPSLTRGLTNLFVMDNKRIDFEFLSQFEWLHCFCTNLMSKQMLLDKIDRLNQRSTFELHLCHRNSLLVCKQKPDRYDLIVRENMGDEEDEEDEMIDESNLPCYELPDPSSVQERAYFALSLHALRQRVSEDLPEFRHWFDA